jgi:hypothetical protein
LPKKICVFPIHVPKSILPIGSHRALASTQQELLNLHWPPEKFGDAVLRKAFPTKALGIVYVIIQQMQLVKLGVDEKHKILDILASSKISWSWMGLVTQGLQIVVH